MAMTSEPQRKVRMPRAPYGLSARLLVLTVAFVMLCEILIYAPSIARFREDYLRNRLAAAHLATLALEATPDNMVSEELKNELLDHARAHAIIIARPGARRILTRDMPPTPEETYDLRDISMATRVADAFLALTTRENKVIRVIGLSTRQDDVVVEVLLDSAPMHKAMVAYSWRILGLSLAISFATACLVYLALQWLMVRPLRRLTENMMEFRDSPESASSVIATSDRRDEIGVMQRELADMEGAVRAALGQRARLAALGTALTKINHDLRNILATARLVSDRLADSSDPNVRRLAPTVVAAIDRAVALCGQTLDYARDDLPQPQRTAFEVCDLVEEVGRVVGLLTDNRAGWHNAVSSEILVDADRDQMFRVLTNLGRNAVEAGARRVQIDGRRAIDGTLTLDISDDGPGLAPKARDKMFQPFAGSARAGGTGLGLAIARELVRAHGGELTLVQSSAQGTVFRIDLPRAAVRRERAAE